MHARILVLGAGITGLSACWHLERLGVNDYMLAEAEAVPGGLCRSEMRDGFTFDQSGHLLHLRDPYALETFQRLLPGNLHRLPRCAFIYTRGARVPFPFQAHLGFLPPDVRDECLRGAANAPSIPRPRTFKDWCLAAFGPGIYKHFLRPYNVKLWNTDPADMTAEWCGEFVPRPDLAAIRAGARGEAQDGLGYNAHFYYPLTGGCQAITDALAARVKNLRLNAPVTHIDWAAKTACIAGETVHFEHLLSTIPLPVLLRAGNNERLHALAGDLSCAAVTVLNIAAAQPFDAFSWAYFPDGEDPFFRVGAQSSFSPHAAPAGCSSFYAELPGAYPRTPQGQTRVLSTLAQKGIIKEEDVLFSFWRTLPYAYAIYNPNRPQAVQEAQNLMAEHGVRLAGRYGKWEYSFMERGFLQGRDAAFALYKELR